MKVIFLDCDGVINTENNDGMVSPRHKRRLEELVNETGAKIVLTSTWRLNPSWLELMAWHGFDKSIFIGATPHLEGKPRIEEIKAWLNEHPEVEKFSILEDNLKLLFGFPMISIDAEFGLTEHGKRKVVEYLNGSS